MKRLSLALISVNASLITAVLLPSQALADNGPAGNCGGVAIGTPGLQNLCGSGGIYGLLNGIITFLLGIIGGLAVLAIIVSGIQYITSQGSPDALKKAKTRLTNAVVGLILLSLTGAILVYLGLAKL